MAVQWRRWARSISCVLCLGLFFLSEFFSAAGTALDRRAPAWARSLGWLLFLLAAELVAAAAMLFIPRWARLGYRLVLLNLALFAGCFVAGMFFHRAAPLRRADWLTLGIWVVYLAAAALSARFMVAGSQAVADAAASSHETNESSARG
jgi:hypothetical protein